MTNVQTSRRHSCCRLLQAVCLIAAVNTITPDAVAQGLFDQFNSSNSGVSAGASELVDVNRRSFGVNTRIGHVTGNSVGRIDPVTYLNVAPYFNVGPNAFIFDFQMGRANEGGLTGHAGGVFRTFVEEWDVVTGISAHHSRDDISGVLFRTWGLGVDVASDTWEARANYVRPNGTTSRIASQSIDQTSGAYMGNNIVFDRIDTVAEALEGFDLEVGSLLFADAEDRVKLRGFMGAYRYFSPAIPHFTGWKTHVQADVMKRLELDLALTEDTQFKTTVSFNAVVHFGGFKADDYTSKSAIHRLADPVRRNLSVPTVQTNSVVSGIPAINPADGMPYQIVHVMENGNGGPFLGTVEAPLNSIATGLGVPGADVVFVHAGGTYAAAPDNMITVGNQRVFGEGLISATTGQIVESMIPIAGLTDELILPGSPTFLASGMTLARPTMANAAGNAVTLLDGGEFGGFIVSAATGAGITSNNAGNVEVHDTLVENVLGAGILLQNTTGTTNFVDTVISGAGGPAFHVNGGNGVISFSAESVDTATPTASIVNSSQQAVLIENMTSGGTVRMLRASITDTGGAGIDILNNAAGTAATLDNITVTNSAANGIRILNSDGEYIFSNTRGGVTGIINAAMESILIENLGATAPATATPSVAFNAITITGRNAEGIAVDNNFGAITFGAPVTIDTPSAGGTGAGVSVQTSQAGSSVSFNSGLSINGSNGRGIELTDNLADSIFSVDVSGSLALSNTAEEAFLIGTNAGDVEVNGPTTIASRSMSGISIQNSSGTIGFGAVGITNVLDSVSAAVDIQNSAADVSFADLTIDNAMGNLGGGAGINLVSNMATGTTSGLTATQTFAEIDVTSVDGVGLFALNNTHLLIRAGRVDSTNAAAVDIEEVETRQVTLTELTSTDSVDFGLRLVNAAPPTGNTFIVGSLETGGGRVTNAVDQGALLQNAGQVTFNRMLIDANRIGVAAMNMGLTQDDDQFLRLFSVQVVDSVIQGVNAENVTTVQILDSFFEDNGTDGTLGAESVLLTYSEIPTDVIGNDEVFDYTVEIGGATQNSETVIVDNTDDAIRIQSVGNGDGAAISVNIFSTAFTLDGVVDPIDTEDAAVVFDWEGVANVRLVNNLVTLTGANDADDDEGDTRGFIINTRSPTELLTLDVFSNLVMSTDFGSIGLDVETAGPSDINVGFFGQNTFQLSGPDSIGIRMDLADTANVDLSNNLVELANGGVGFQFDLVEAPSLITINNNLIRFGDALDLNTRGINFRSISGIVNLQGNQNNVIEVFGSPGTSPLVPFFPAVTNSINGGIIVNGVFVPQ